MPKLFDKKRIAETNTERGMLLDALHRRMDGEAPTNYMPDEIGDLLIERADLMETYKLAKLTIQTDLSLLAVDFQEPCSRSNTKRVSCRCEACPKLFETMCAKNELLRFTTVMITHLVQIISILDALGDFDAGILDMEDDDAIIDDVGEGR